MYLKHYEIDEQHKKILMIINNLSDLFAEKKHQDSDEISKIIKKLADYAIYHFQTEEKYFQDFRYEKAAEHIAVHNQYRLKIDEWQRNYNEKKDDKVFLEISNFLKEWWIWHINNNDREYVPLLKANGLK